jgi:hypothetical protein
LANYAANIGSKRGSAGDFKKPFNGNRGGLPHERAFSRPAARSNNGAGFGNCYFSATAMPKSGLSELATKVHGFKKGEESRLAILRLSRMRRTVCGHAHVKTFRQSGKTWTLSPICVILVYGTPQGWRRSGEARRRPPPILEIEDGTKRNTYT